MEKALINLYKLILNPNKKSNDIINHIEKYNINVNTYLPTLSENSPELPLVYYCCMRNDLDDLLKYLLHKGVNLNVNTEIELLIYSDNKYIKKLIENGCLLRKEEFLKRGGNAYKLIINGNINKILYYYKCNILLKDELISIVNTENIIFDILDQLYLKIFNICKTIDNVEIQINELLKYYIDVFKFFLKNGISVNSIHTETNSIFSQNILNTYIYDLISLCLQYNIDFNLVKFYHYSNISLNNKIVMSPLYNTENFNKINDLLNNYIIPKKIRIITN
jgi:hypothetical protein